MSVDLLFLEICGMAGGKRELNILANLLISNFLLIEYSGRLKCASTFGDLSGSYPSVLLGLFYK